ncbi:TPA: hypothetical protein ACJIWU_000075 [Enterobacter chengduensis]|uniref:Uncharacterized protein n=2 Tax=Enterobacter chengduensis TaxID=2494701 RepID=A0AAW3HF81_9ENTR|nr:MULTISPECIES: hypothetical protein [Enterobacter cloacae complex]GJL39485.1 hypothetical protein TUM17577_06940 [Enterobacter asburiae]KJX35204.1 hypothetical protein SG71_16990 [Enterobacter chengduensis]MCG0457809.1 hypothetical protein [Enterobacter cloacae complex sp. ECC445]MCK1096145.1 hypothetical protein [Enterobacter chengduensis]MCK6817487.1 hypothetical protein [Enterobacter chengduensis]
MATDDRQRLESLKDRLKDQFGVPVGVHMTGIPLAISTLLTIFCYALLQVSVWILLFRLLGLPEFKVMMGVFFAAVVYCMVVMSTMFLTARGSLIGYKLHISVITLTGVMSIVYFLWTWISLLFSAVENYTPQITSLLGLGFFCLNIVWMNTSVFYRSIALTLHNRVWRKQLKIENRQMAGLKR